MANRTTTRRITEMPSSLYISPIFATDIRLRRMAEAARYREVRHARRAEATNGAVRLRGEPVGRPAPPRRRRRWLALP